MVLKYLGILKVLLPLLPFILGSCGDRHSQKLVNNKTPRVSTAITALPETVQAPPSNLPSEDKEILSKLLFFDPILSGGKDVACATCHHPQNGYSRCCPKLTT